MKKTNDFPFYVSTFLTSYLAGQKNHSTNTIQSYRDTFVLLLKFLHDVRSIAIEKVSLDIINRDVVGDFLQWIENERGCSISTRNQRLAAIHAFFRYIQSIKPEYMFQCQQILHISSKKAPQKPPDYLTVDGIKELLSCPDLTTATGRRDAALLSLLYDSGARVQELADLTPKTVRLDSPAYVELTGKGRKTRSVPLLGQTVKLLSSYMSERRLFGKDMFNHPLFYNCHGNKLTRQGIAYIINKYTGSLEQEKPVSAHWLRHSKVMHLTQADVNPIYIRDILGHVDLQTTAIYSKADMNMKRKALEKANVNAIPDIPDWTSNGQLMDFLKSLGK